MTVQTAVLIETLVALGAEVRWASCNIFSTQDHAAAAIVVGPHGTPEEPAGVPVFAWKGETLEEYWWCTEQMLSWPDGERPEHDPRRRRRRHHARAQGRRVREGRRRAADRRRATPRSTPSSSTCCAARSRTSTTRWTEIAAGIKGVTEETTTGVHRLYQMPRPASCSSRRSTSTTRSPRASSTTSTAAATRSSTASTAPPTSSSAARSRSSAATATSARAAPSRCAARARASSSPRSTRSARCRRRWTATRSRTLEDVIEQADIVITATGNKDIVTVEHMKPMKHQAILGNIGHFDNEIDMAGLAGAPGRQAHRHQAAGRRVDLRRRPLDHRAVRGSPAEPRQRDRPPVVRDEQLLHQPGDRADRAVHQDRRVPDDGVYGLPKHLDEKVARLHLDALGVRLTELTKKQAEYIGVDVDGPYKPEHYRY